MKIVFILFSALGFGSCILSQSQIETTMGNYYFDRGDNFLAQLYYLKAIDSSPSGADLAFYNLGNVYERIGEYDAAFKMWDRALATPDKDLLAKLQFNRGVVFYKTGDFVQAQACFRSVLDLNNTSLNSKKYLELINQRIDKIPQATSAKAPENITDEEVQRLFDVLRQKEEKAWNKVQSADQNSDTLDW